MKKENIFKKLSNKSFRQIGAYMLSNFLSRGIAFLFLPIFSYYISEKGFGTLALINNSILLLNSLILFSVPVTLTAEYYKRDKESYKTLFTSLFGYVSLSTVLSAILIWIFLDSLSHFFGFRWYYVFLLPGLTFLNFFSEQLNNYMRIRDESFAYLIINVSKVILEIGIAISILFSLHNDYNSRIISISITSLLLGIYGFYYFFVKLDLFGKFNFKVILNELLFGVSIFVMQIGIFLMGSSDKFFVKLFYDDEITGIYSMASTLAAILFVLSSSIMSYLTQVIYKILNNESVDRLFVLEKEFRKYVVLICLATILVFLFGTLAYNFLIKGTYIVGYKAFCILIAGNFFWAIVNFFHPIFWHFRSHKKLFLIASASIFISIPVYYILVKSFSINGAAFSLLLIYLIISFLMYNQAQVVLKRNINT